MATFEELRDQLGGWRDQNEKLRQDLLVAREDVKRGRRDRSGDVRRLEVQQNELFAQGAGIWNGFQAFIDPKATLQRLEDGSPILLFPLRIETRFKTSVEGQPQLWVRVYPDQCLVDSFEPSLTEEEVRNARVFWAKIWRAGGVEAEERTAWRDLTASHGVGRAGWIISEYKPLNPGDKPARDAAGDVLLIVHAPAALTADAVTFWKKVWTAGGDAESTQAATPALVGKVGQAAAQAIVANPPVNLADLPVEANARAATITKVVGIQLTPPDEMPARRSSWSSSPRVDLLPERLVLIGYRGATVELEVASSPIQTPLAAGPDPNAAPTDQLKPVADTIQIPAELEWMFDFEAALQVGMAFRIDLTLAQAESGFDKIIVLGVRVSDDAARGRKNLEQLITHHLHSRPGLSIVPQGTPTNNTEKGGSGFRFGDDPNAGFEAFFLGKPLYAVESDPLARRDGQWLADTLGLAHDLVQRIPNAEGFDQIDARAMHLALFPGTLGYTMRTMLKGVFAESDVDATREFMARYALGRGWIPAVRVGEQPYGILPATDFSRVNWFSDRRMFFRDDGFLRRLYGLLRRIEDEWAPLRDDVSFVGKRGGADPHQVLLDVLTLHAASVEYYPLKADSEEQYYHRLALMNFPVARALKDAFVEKPEAMSLLREFGYAGTEEPEAITKLFSSAQPRLTGPVVDEPPLSETEPLTKVAGAMNYIEWLAKAAATDIETIQAETGFDAGKRPRSLLYLLLRHAMQLSYHLVGAKEKVRIDPTFALATLMVEPKFVHVAAAAPVSESKYGLLMETLPDRGNIRLADFITQNIRFIDPELTEQLQSLDRLANASTARLERAFAEHIDCCSYRFDAWKQGILHWQLERMRNLAQGEGGIFLGAFGWLENVRPENKNLTPVQLPDDVAASVNRPGDPTLTHDPTNAGLIHAPSLNHATTAAVLRNGYLSNDGRMAIDLSSRRVRLALGIMEGMRNGQSLGALLGYHFERQLHDSSTITVRALVFDMRRKFPLVANRIRTTEDPTKAIEAIAAMNVVDGLKLVRHVEQSSVKMYPYGLADVPAPNPASLGPIVDAAVAYIADINDAVADLVLAEGVHQAVNGNFDRSAGTLDAFSKGGYPPEPEVIQTPRTGTALVLRTGIHLNPAPPAPAVATPLARTEPALDAWLKDRLPAPANVGCNVKFTDRTTNAAQTIFVSQAQLALAPIDVLYHLDVTQDTGLRFLDDRIVAFLHANRTPKLDGAIEIAYTERVAGRVNWFELQALTVSLRALVIASRPLQPADLIRTNDIKAAEMPASVLDGARLVNVRNELRTARLPALTALIAGLAAGPIDAAIDSYVAEVSRLAMYRLPQTGIGFAYEWRTGYYGALAKKLGELRLRWQDRLAECNTRLNDFDGAPGVPEADKILALQTAEILVSTSYVEPAPANSTLYRAAVGTKRNAFQAKLGQLDGIANTHFATVDALLQTLLAEDLTPFDFDGLKLTEDVAEADRFRAQLTASAKGLEDELTKKKFSADADALLAGTPSLANIQKSAQLLFGEDFRMIPTFLLPTVPASTLAAAWTHSTSGGLTKFLRETVGREFPVDDWLHGVARVRDKMHHWENAILLTEAFGAQPPDLTPLQTPFAANEPWFALEIPSPATPGARAVPSDRLLYAAHFAQALDVAKPICGLLVDEWTEVIPEDTETTGIAFHYDRPNSEPPQTWLLAMPAVMNGAWSWDELLGAVNDALDSAKRRAIEPTHIDSTRFGWLLPATYAAYTFPEISISNYLLRNVRIFDQIVQK